MLNKPIDDKREYVRCALCGSDTYKVVFANSHDKFMKLLKIKGKSSMVMCDNCSLVYHNPRIKKKLLDELYINYEYPTRTINAQALRCRDAQERFEWLSCIHGEVDTVLEIGCAEGFILDLFRATGKEVLGVDPSHKYTLLGKERGILIQTMFFDENFQRSSSANVTNLWGSSAASPFLSVAPLWCS